MARGSACSDRPPRDGTCVWVCKSRRRSSTRRRGLPLCGCVKLASTIERGYASNQLWHESGKGLADSTGLPAMAGKARRGPATGSWGAGGPIRQQTARRDATTALRCGNARQDPAQRGKTRRARASHVGGRTVQDAAECGRPTGEDLAGPILSAWLRRRQNRHSKHHYMNTRPARNVSFPCARGVPIGAETSVAESEWPKVVTIRIRRFPRCAGDGKRGNEGGVGQALRQLGAKPRDPVSNHAVLRISRPSVRSTTWELNHGARE
jgi:hypothetical protein